MDQGFIGVLLVFKTAHEASAGAGDLGGVQAQILGLRHFNGYGLEILQKFPAAEGTSADAQTPDQLGLVPHADLPQLDAGVESPGQILDQLPEIHPLVGGEVKQDLAAVKGALRPDKLHVETMGGDLLTADVAGTLLPGLVLRGDPLILGGGPADDFAQGGNDLLLGDHMVSPDAGSVFRTPGGVDDHMVTGGEAAAVRVKIIGLLPRAELNIHDFHRRLRCGAEYFFHRVLLFG